MVPFSAFATARWQYGSPRLERYNGIPSVEIMGQAAPGISTGEAMAEMEKMAAQLPAGIGYEWTGLSYEEKNAGAQAPALYAISLLVVFLSVAALYESWTIPFVNLLMLPLGLVGAITAVIAAGPPQRHLSPDRSADHHRAFHQERHPDHPVHQGPDAPGA